jgi:hypothetical protein
MEDATINIESGSDEEEFLRTGLDLIVQYSDGREERLPVCRALTTLGSASDAHLRLEDVAPRQALLHYRAGQLYFTNADTRQKTLVNGQPCNFRELGDQDEIALGPTRIRVVGLMDQLATLEGYTPPYRERHWAVGADPVLIGRPGKR